MNKTRLLDYQTKFDASNYPREIQLSADGSHIAGKIVTGRFNPKVVGVSLCTSSGRRLADIKHASTLLSVALSSAAKIIATGHRDHAVRLWSFKGELLHTFNEPSGQKVALKHNNPVAFSSNGQLVAYVTSSSTLEVRNTSTGERIKSKALFSCKPPRKHRAKLQLAFSPDGSAIGIGEVGSAQLFQMETDSMTLLGGKVGGKVHKRVAFWGDKQTIIVGTHAGLALYDLQGKRQHVRKIPKDDDNHHIVQFAASAIEKRLVLNYGREAVVLNDHLKVTQSLRPKVKAPIHDVAMSHNGALIALIHSKCVTMWDAAEGFIRSINIPSFSAQSNSLGFSQSGQWFGYVNGPHLYFYDLERRGIKQGMVNDGSKLIEQAGIAGEGDDSDDDENAPQYSPKFST